MTPRTARVAVSAMLLSIYSTLPNRHYDLRDVGFNALAGTMALTAAGFIRWSAKPPRLAVVLAVLLVPQPAPAMLKWTSVQLMVDMHAAPPSACTSHATSGLSQH